MEKFISLKVMHSSVHEKVPFLMEIGQLSTIFKKRKKKCIDKKCGELLFCSKPPTTRSCGKSLKDSNALVSIK